MIPVSPITEIFRSKQFIQEEWEQVLSKLDIVNDTKIQDPWQSLLFVNYAALNMQDALDRLQTVKMDDGLTRPYALYIAATRQ